MQHRAAAITAALASLLAAAPGPLAAGTIAGGAPSTGSFTVAYDGYAHGLIALKMTASLTLTPTTYSGELAFHTAGMVGWMVHNVSDSQVQGRFVNNKPAPMLFSGTGNLRGVDRVTRITYKDGNPIVEALAPPVETERTAVPPGQTLHTVDTLSAMAMLVKQVAETGTCNGATTVFDGRRLTALTASTGGEVQLDPSAKTHFSGQALRCDFVGNQLAGFLKRGTEDQQARPRHGSAWFAPLVPGAPPVPVRVTFENNALGLVTLYLTSVSGGPGAVAQR